MKKLIMLLLVFFAYCPFVLGSQIGPATPGADHGQVNVGVGYFYHEAEWDNVDIEQKRIFLHAGYGLGIEEEPLWEVYIRLGAADLEAEDFDGDFEPFGIFGVKGEIWGGKVFGWGAVFQGGYFYDFEDDQNNLEIEGVWEIELGVPFQAKLGSNFFVYAGPVVYHEEADAKNSTGSTKLQDDNDVGGFGGFSLSLGNVSFDVEAQYKSDFSVGGMVSVQF